MDLGGRAAVPQLASELSRLAGLLWGTVLMRPYVWAFVLCFVACAGRHLGGRDASIFALWAYLCAYSAEFASTRIGLPFGRYHYHDQSRHQELWLSNIPAWDPLSFVFLAYFCWLAAAGCRRPGAPSQALRLPGTAAAAAAVMTWLDIIIDPVTLRGGRWFLGDLYCYPAPGPYFGVTWENFVGWFVTGLGIVAGSLGLARLGLLRPQRWRPLGRAQLWLAWAVLAGVCTMMAAVAGTLGEPLLTWTTCGLGGAGLALIGRRLAAGR